MNFDWDLRSVVLTVAAFQAIVVSVMLLVRNRQHTKLPDRLLALFLLAMSANLTEHILGWLGLYESQWLTYFPFGDCFLFAPLAYLYIKSITNNQHGWHKKYWLHFIPAAIYFAVHFTAWARPLVQKQLAIDWLWQHKWHQVEGYGNALLFSVYLFLNIRHYTAYIKWLPTEYSNTEKLQLHWIRNFLILLGIYYAVYIGFGIYSELYGWYGYKIQFWQYLVLAIIIYYISATGYAYVQKYKVAFDMDAGKIPNVPGADNTVEDEAGNTSPAAAVINPGFEVLKEQLLNHLQNSKPYLDPELSLSQLALEMEKPPYVITQVIKTALGKNFNDLINGYRVAAVIEKLKAGEQKTQTLTSIGYDCGFNSKATFNRAFKKATGTNPGEFAQKL
jgi:AraC-like DNA-binding protein